MTSSTLTSHFSGSMTTIFFVLRLVPFTCNRKVSKSKSAVSARNRWRAPAAKIILFNVLDIFCAKNQVLLAWSTQEISRISSQQRLDARRLLQVNKTNNFQYLVYVIGDWTHGSWKGETRIQNFILLRKKVFRSSERARRRRRSRKRRKEN